MKEGRRGRKGGGEGRRGRKEGEEGREEGKEVEEGKREANSSSNTNSSQSYNISRTKGRKSGSEVEKRRLGRKQTSKDRKEVGREI
jgi:hypothetical protein